MLICVAAVIDAPSEIVAAAPSVVSDTVVAVDDIDPVFAMLPELAVMLMDDPVKVLPMFTAVLPDAVLPVISTVPRPTLATLVVTAPAVTVKFCPAAKEPRVRALLPLFNMMEPEPLPLSKDTLLLAVEKFAVPPPGRLTLSAVDALIVPAAD
jgi:hypothetical protein